MSSVCLSLDCVSIKGSSAPVAVRLRQAARARAPACPIQRLPALHPPSPLPPPSPPLPAAATWAPTRPFCRCPPPSPSPRSRVCSGMLLRGDALGQGRQWPGCGGSGLQQPAGGCLLSQQAATVGALSPLLHPPTHRLRARAAGWLVGLSWRSFETWGQVSLRNRLMVQGDWLKVRGGSAGDASPVWGWLSAQAGLQLRGGPCCRSGAARSQAHGWRAGHLVSTALPMQLLPPLLRRPRSLAATLLRPEPDCMPASA